MCTLSYLTQESRILHLVASWRERKPERIMVSHFRVKRSFRISYLVLRRWSVEKVPLTLELQGRFKNWRALCGTALLNCVRLLWKYCSQRTISCFMFCTRYAIRFSYFTQVSLLMKELCHNWSAKGPKGGFNVTAALKSSGEWIELRQWFIFGSVFLNL